MTSSTAAETIAETAAETIAETAAETAAETVTTDRFVISRGEFAKAMFMRYGKQYIIVCLALIIAAGVAAYFDIRFLILALMVIFIITPMLAAWLYFNHGLRPENVLNILPHTITFLPSELLVSLYILPSSKESDASDRSDSSDKNSERKVEYRIAIPAGVTRSTDSRTFTLPISLQAGSSGFLRIPFSAFPSPVHLRRAITILDNCTLA